MNRISKTSFFRIAHTVLAVAALAILAIWESPIIATACLMGMFYGASWHDLWSQRRRLKLRAARGERNDNRRRESDARARDEHRERGFTVGQVGSILHFEIIEGYAGEPRDPPIEGVQMICGDEIVIEDESFTLVVDYPLREAQREASNWRPDGWTRRQILDFVRDIYGRIYAAERAHCGDIGSVEGTGNRRKSDGPYGIWGHHIGDLILEGCEYDTEAKVLSLIVGS